MVANKYAFLQITRRRFLNEWEAFKKVISRRNIRRRITIRSEERFSRNAETDLVCRLLLEKKKKKQHANNTGQRHQRKRARSRETIMHGHNTNGLTQNDISH